MIAIIGTQVLSQIRNFMSSNDINKFPLIFSAVLLKFLFFVIFLFLEVFDAGQLWTGGRTVPHVLGMHSLEEKLERIYPIPLICRYFYRQSCPRDRNQISIKGQEIQWEKNKILELCGLLHRNSVKSQFDLLQVLLKILDWQRLRKPQFGGCSSLYHQ